MWQWNESDFLERFTLSESLIQDASLVSLIVIDVWIFILRSGIDFYNSNGFWSPENLDGNKSVDGPTRGQTRVREHKDFDIKAGLTIEDFLQKGQNTFNSFLFAEQDNP